MAAYIIFFGEKRSFDRIIKFKPVRKWDIFYLIVYHLGVLAHASPTHRQLSRKDWSRRNRVHPLSVCCCSQLRGKHTQGTLFTRRLALPLALPACLPARRLGLVGPRGRVQEGALIRRQLDLPTAGLNYRHGFVHSHRAAESPPRGREQEREGEREGERGGREKGHQNSSCPTMCKVTKACAI